MKHPFDGHRVYNGCPDDTLQAKLDAHKPYEKKALKICPTLFCTYFPIERKYSMGSSEPFLGVCAYGTLDKLHDTKLEAWESILTVIEKADLAIPS